MTGQQFMVLDMMNRERKAIVFGCAGSGKTLLALEKARRLANEGNSVLFTCYNARLAEWIADWWNPAAGIEVSHFHKLCSDIAREAGIDIPPVESDVVQGDEAFFFGEVLPQALVDASETLGPLFDVIIADEGQDFMSNWWLALESLQRGSNLDIFYIFCDDNQSIYRGRENDYPFASPSITLTQNCRNTQEIHSLVDKYYEGTQDILSIGPAGRPVEFVSAGNASTMRRSLKSTVHRLINDQMIPPEQLVVLTPLSSQKSSLSEGEQLGNFELTWKRSSGGNLIHCSTIHSFKGLEKPVIIAVELDQIHPSEVAALGYVAFSRAQNHLVVIGPPSLLSRIEK